MTWFWAAWLVFIGVSFAVAEGWALKTNRMTLSRWTWDISKAWPPFPFFVGLIVGFLACHFWWGGIVSFAPVS